MNDFAGVENSGILKNAYPTGDALSEALKRRRRKLADQELTRDNESEGDKENE